MTGFELYTLILCIIVFAVFTVLFSFLIGYVLRTSVRLIALGGEDKTVMKEAPKIIRQRKKKKTLANILSTVLCLILAVVFIFAVLMSCGENDYADDSASLKVVKSGSMERKNEKNTYLFENGLDNQIGTFDLIVTHPLPPEDELKLYDIVVYELDGDMILHRIIGIEKPNGQHPDERYFLLRGDAVSTSDPFPVKYSQMKAIYKNERIPFVGSFIAFLQSPAGWLCVILVLFTIIVTPIGERRLSEAMISRYEVLCSSGITPMPDTALETDARSKKRRAQDKRVITRRAACVSDAVPMCFDELLSSLSYRARAAYRETEAHLLACRMTRLDEGLVYRSFGRGRAASARFLIEDKHLYLYIALNPNETSDRFTLTDGEKAGRKSKMPIRVRLSSRRNTRLAAELINEAISNAYSK